MFDLPEIRRSKTDQAYEYIKQELIAGRWSFGQEISVVSTSDVKSPIAADKDSPKSPA
ncbi:hypothetical protein [Hydrogenibacillus sp. N12]|uniref:hypothetical protein n=1 Tax=Hydrogenibacillus sp. N12 TaxID=2866627 RepID=UPI001C7D68F9|nr:hypothetical protein [Hydrogenibacillus sp. N12]QZA33811.1 hypothetical protein K2M58_04675 [Hydrogenibacillus sp. N12]